METYASPEALAAWLVGSTYEDETPEGPAAERILTRASEVIEWCSRGTYEPDPDADPEVPEAITTALAEATCAQVEQWLEVGEELDVGGWDRSRGVKYGAVTLDALPATLAPRAARILSRAEILNEVGQEAAGMTGDLQAPIGVDIV